MSAELLGVLCLRRNQPQVQLMVLAEQARRIDEIGVVHRVQNVLHSHVRSQHSRRVGRDLKLRLLPALHQYARDSV